MSGSYGSSAAVDQLANMLLDRLVGPLAERVAKELGLAANEEPQTEPLLKPDQLAARLAVNTETVYRWIRKCADFPCVKIGAGKHPSYRARLSEVEAWLRKEADDAS